jgi:hypothetical protein
MGLAVAGSHGLGAVLLGLPTRAGTGWGDRRVCILVVNPFIGQMHLAGQAGCGRRVRGLAEGWTVGTGRFVWDGGFCRTGAGPGWLQGGMDRGMDTFAGL